MNVFLWKHGLFLSSSVSKGDISILDNCKVVLLFTKESRIFFWYFTISEITFTLSFWIYQKTWLSWSFPSISPISNIEGHFHNSHKYLLSYKLIELVHIKMWTRSAVSYISLSLCAFCNVKINFTFSVFQRIIY